MRLLAIDPGHMLSAWLEWDGKKILGFGKIANAELLDAIRKPSYADILALERVQSMGMSVGEEVFETCRWEARYAMVWEARERPLLLVPRIRVKMHHCDTMKAKDKNIRQALIDRFGNGKEEAIGTKKNQGPLYGISSDVWSALAIATSTFDVCTKYNWNLETVRELWLRQTAK